MATVLVVDDVSLDRAIAGGFVREEGLDAVYAQDGSEAFRIIQRDKPDAVLTDLQMPEIDGLELVRRVSQDHPTIPVVLMTAHGSEEVAVAALKAGAASYVPKKNLKQDLGEALRHVLDAAQARRQHTQALQILRRCETHLVLGYEREGPGALVGYLQSGLMQLGFCDDGVLLRISTAITEAVANAIDHGNLELDSTLRASSDDAYRILGDQRTQEPPYRDRRVHVTAKLTPSEATYIVRDEGPGFDPSTLPDPTDPENLTKPNGRGLMLIRTFMDEVRFNDKGNEITLVKRRSG